MPSSLSLAEKLTVASEASYDYIELSIDETDEKLNRLSWDHSERKGLLDAMDSIGIRIRSICLSGHRKYPLGHPDFAVRQRSMAIMCDAICLASDLGIRLIQIAGYDVYYVPSSEESKKRFAENIAIAVEVAAREGVILAFETMETPFMDTTAKAMHWVHEMDSPYLQVYPDTGNVTNAAALYGTTLEADLGTGHGHLAALHLKESNPGVYREVPYGHGHVDFKEATKVALSLGVRMFVGEFWYTGEEDWRNLLKENGLFLRSALKEGEKALGL
jgi:predicted hexulose-6-phosphate isomerase